MRCNPATNHVIHQTSLSPGSGTLEELAKQGKVILQLDGPPFLVWSGALRLASPVFGAMFDASFSIIIHSITTRDTASGR
jgi:hypothetical protein